MEKASPKICVKTADEVRRAGQAMVELVVALIAILAVAAGLLLVSDLVRADTETLTAATGEAIADALSGSIPDSFTPVQDWDAGADGMRHTKDDRVRTGSFLRVRQRITRYTAPGGDWSGTRRMDGADAAYGDIVDFNDGVTSRSVLSFVRGEASSTVDTLPVTQSLLGMPATLTVRNETWMPTTGGLY